jgi:hypothetical protein
LADHHVGRGVVADGEHHPGYVSQRDFHLVLEQAEFLAAGHALRWKETYPLNQIQLSGSVSITPPRSHRAQRIRIPLSSGQTEAAGAEVLRACRLYYFT